MRSDACHTTSCLLSAWGDDHFHRRPAEVGSGLPRASRRWLSGVGIGLPRASHGNSQGDGATPMATSVCAAAKCVKVVRCWRFHVFRFFDAVIDSAWPEEVNDGVEPELEEARGV